MRVSHEGQVSMQNRYDITVKCEVNLKYYPYDEQKCSIIIESWFYTTEQVSNIYGILQKLFDKIPLASSKFLHSSCNC